MIRTLALASTALILLSACNPQQANTEKADAGAASAPAAPAAVTQARLGEIAPDFTLVDADGTERSLAAFRGRTVVLEWTNAGCPFVRKHYDSGNMQKTQGAALAQGAVWLTINSGAPGKQGHVDYAGAKASLAKERSKASHYLLDAKGVVGRGYGAKTTPQMVIIDPKGVIVYQGGIDDKATAKTEDIAGARNHVIAALEELKAGKPVSVKETRSYGCSVKYSDG